LSTRDDRRVASTSLLLLHGLSANGGVWAEFEQMLEGDWSGRWSAPDLPGHGAAPRLAHYSFGSLASAGAVSLDPGERVVVLGHSLGGVVGLALADGSFGVDVQGVVALGVKVAWTDDELARAEALAARPPTTFGSRADAAARFVRVAGLEGLVDDDHPAVRRGIARVDNGWRLTADPATIGVGAPDMPGLLAAARAPAELARGEYDPLQTTEQLRALDPAAVELSGLGHNAQVEDPRAVWELVRRLATDESGSQAQS
jgi:pimeloyl-ACP methyl ester carboxylesterase